MYPALLSFSVLLFISSQLNVNQPSILLSASTKESLARSSTCILFEESFEGEKPLTKVHSTDFGTIYAFSVVTNPVFKGSKAARFELRNTDPLVNNGKRAEATIVKGTTSNSFSRWYSFAAYFPSSDFLKDSQQEVISQWHQSPDKHLGEQPQSPATALRIKNDRFYLDTGYNGDVVSDGVYPDSRKKITIGPVVKDTWNQFVFHFIHSYKDDGLIEVWHNGKKVIIHKGGNMYNNVMMPKWKLGIYKASFKHGTSDVQKRVVYFDEIRAGNENATLADMAPNWKEQPQVHE